VQVAFPEIPILRDQGVPAAGGFVQPGGGRERQVGKVVQGVGQKRQGAAQVLQVVKAVVQYQQDQ
jgi:hypothetical protein